MTRPLTSSPDAQTLELFERVRQLEFARRYDEALALLEAGALLSPKLEAARGVLLIFTGDLAGARAALSRALSEGYRGALAGLSTVQRLCGEPRLALLELQVSDLEGLEDFERANLERETGLYFEELGRLEAARQWLERAWHSALIGAHGQYQLAGIAQGLGRVLGRLGFDSLGINVLDEGLRHARADRRVPLLYERIIRALNLGLVQRAGDDLEELRVFVPDQPDLALLARYAEARTQLLDGDEAGARGQFELLLAFSDIHDTPLGREVSTHSLLYLVKLETDAERFERVPKLLKRLDALVLGPREAAWRDLRRARWVSGLGDHGDAAEGLSGVIDRLAQLGWRIESGIARLHRAEALLRDGPNRTPEADAEIAVVLALADFIGSAAPFGLELRPLTRLRAYLQRGFGPEGSGALLAPSAEVHRARLATDRLELDGVRIAVSGRTLRLMQHLVAHPSSPWSNLRNTVFADLEDAAALEAFAVCRVEIMAVDGFSLERRAAGQRYSLVWQGLSLER